MTPASRQTSVQTVAGQPELRARRLAIPTTGTGGLAADASPHFGRSPCFTVVELNGGEPTRVILLENAPHSNCEDPVALLQAHQVDALIVRGIGMRPLTACQRAGIGVLVGRGRTVGDFIAAYLAGGLAAIDERDTCGCRGEHS
jgi:predicted Fe-Mo cluster-binding NifX family protein